MTPVYSTQFLSLAGLAGGLLPYYFVPPERVAVVKSVVITIGINLVPCWAAVKQTSTGQILAAIGFGVSDIPTHDKQCYTFWLHQVLEAGDGLSCEANNCAVDISAGGYLLVAP